MVNSTGIYLKCEKCFEVITSQNSFKNIVNYDLIKQKASLLGIWKLILNYLL